MIRNISSLALRRIRQWQVVGASRYPDFLATANFRQAITIVFLFLVMTLGSILGCSALSASLIRIHVHDILLNDVYSHSLRDGLENTESAIARLRGERQDQREGERPIVVVLDKAGRLLYHNAGGDVRALENCRMELPCLKRMIGGIDGDDLIGLSVMLGDGGVMFRAYNILPMLERMRTIPLVAGAGLFSVLLFCLLVSRHFSRRGLNAVCGIRAALRRYSAGDRQVRMPVSPYGNDLDRLCLDINQNLDRIDRLMEQVRSTSGHIAHELRTPLTHLQNRLYGLAERSDLTHDAQQEINLAVGEVHQLLSLFRAVMRIGEIESGRCVHQFEPIAAQALLQELAEYYQPLAEERGCRLTVETGADVPLFGDRALVFQAMANLVENALKYAAGGPVTLGVRYYRGWMALYVADRGPGIPEALYDKATERFERLGRRDGPGGYGLGLSLVKAISELHRGRLYFQDGSPGLMVYFALNQG